MTSGCQKRANKSCQEVARLQPALIMSALQGVGWFQMRDHMSTKSPCGTVCLRPDIVGASRILHTSQVQDKVSFMINNLTRDNLEAKAEELKKALQRDMWPWFCNYMVIRRVAQEANHQNLYMQVRHKSWIHTSRSHAVHLPYEEALLTVLQQLHGCHSECCTSHFEGVECISLRLLMP